MADTILKATTFGAQEKLVRQYGEGMLTADFIDAAIANGMGYHLTVGALTTPVVGGGNGTVLVLAQPQAIVNVGKGFGLMPIRVSVQVETPLLAADDDEVEILVAADTTGAWGGDGTFTEETMYNMRTDFGTAAAGPLRAASFVSANATAQGGGAIVNDMELARKQIVADSQSAVGVLWTDMDLLYEPKHPPLIVGGSTGAALYVYWGGTVGTSAFAQIQCIAFPTQWLDGMGG